MVISATFVATFASVQSRTVARLMSKTKAFKVSGYFRNRAYVTVNLSDPYTDRVKDLDRVSLVYLAEGCPIASWCKFCQIHTFYLHLPMFAVAVFITAVKAAMALVFRPISRRTPPRFVCLIYFMFNPVSNKLTLDLISLRRSADVHSSAGWTSTALLLIFFLLVFLKPPLLGWFWASVDSAAGSCFVSFFFFC